MIGKLPNGSGGSDNAGLVAARFVTTSNVFEGIGAVAVALPAAGTKTFYVVASAPAGFTISVRLVDVTAGSVVLVTLTTNALVPTQLSDVFVVADGTRRIYLVEVSLDGAPTPADRGICYGASIEVS